MRSNWIEWGETLVPSSAPLREFYKIGEVSELLNVKSYVLRYWETEFPILTPQKTDGNQRLYRRKDLAAAFLIKHLLYNEKFSIEGARNKIRNYRFEKDKNNQQNNIGFSSESDSNSEPNDSTEMTGNVLANKFKHSNEIKKIIDDMIQEMQSI